MCIRDRALARVPDRCGPARVLGSIDSPNAQPVVISAIPAHMVLVAQVHGLGIGTGERLATLFGRAHVRTLVVNGASPFRVVPDTLGEGLILEVPAYADYAQPFNLGDQVRTLLAGISGVAVPFSATLIGVPIRAS